MLRFGVISAYSDEDWHATRLARALRALGKVDVFLPTAFSIWAGDGASGGPTVRAGGRDVRHWDVWLTPRALGEEGDEDFQCGVYAAMGEAGARVVNPVPALLLAIDKARSSWLLWRAGVPTPPAAAVQTLDEAVAALAELAPAVVKPPFGSLGIGVTLLRELDAAARDALGAMLRRHGVVYLQRWVEARPPGTDLRLFVVGDRVPAAIARVAPPGEFRTNVHLGGRVRPFEPTAAMVRLAVRAARILGLDYAGVDVVEGKDGPTVLEVNGTPRWEGILEATGRDMAQDIAAHAARLVRGGRTGRRREEHPWQRTNRKEI